MSRVLATSTLALCVAAGPALAELTPQQVWEDLSAYYEKYGYQVAAGNTDDQGDRLVLAMSPSPIRLTRPPASC